MPLLRNESCGDLQHLSPGKFRGTGRVWQLAVLEWEPWEQRSLSSAVPCLETVQVAGEHISVLGDAARKNGSHSTIPLISWREQHAMTGHVLSEH